MGMGNVFGIDHRSVGHGSRAAHGRGYDRLTERGTFLANTNKSPLKRLFKVEPVPFKPYRTTVVNPKKHKHVNYELAKDCIAYVTGPEGQRAMAEFINQARKYPPGIYRPD
jgi:tungstate transport system substrate-binding protein